MKKYKNFLFISDFFEESGVTIQNEYLVSSEGQRIPLPHSNYIYLGIVDECINAPYAEEFSKEVVDYYSGNGEGYGGYCNYMAKEWVYHLDCARASMKTLIEKLDLKPTDYILRNEAVGELIKLRDGK